MTRKKNQKALRAATPEMSARHVLGRLMVWAELQLNFTPTPTQPTMVDLACAKCCPESDYARNSGFVCGLHMARAYFSKQPPAGPSKETP